MKWWLVGAITLVCQSAACQSAPRARAKVTTETARTPACDSVRSVPRPMDRGVLSAAERDSALKDVAIRRAAWRARGITSYRVRVAAGCFCPWPSTPAVLEVRNGAPVALHDTLGKRFGPVREPWSAYTVERMFDQIEQAVKQSDIVEAKYDPCYGYPTSIRGVGKVKLPDNWFSATANRLTPVP